MRVRLGIGVLVAVLGALVWSPPSAPSEPSDGQPARRPAIPQPWIGLTSFDLGVRLEAGDRRWVDLMAAEGFTVARVVVASVYRTKRTLADGLRQLPLTLSTLAGAGLKAEVVVLVDTAEYSMSRNQMRDHLRAVVAIAQGYPEAIAGIELANERTHGSQMPDLDDPAFLAELEGLVPRQFAASCGSSHGGEPPFVSVCSYVTHHSDRERSPEDNGRIMADAQRASGQLVVDDEALGIAEERRPGARTNDPAYGERQARVARQLGLGGVTLHIEAGLTANVDLLGPIQREAIRRFVAAMRAPQPISHRNEGRHGELDSSAVSGQSPGPRFPPRPLGGSEGQSRR